MPSFYRSDRLGIKIIVYGLLTLGLLAGKYKDKGNLPSGFRKGLLPKIKPLLQTMEVIAQDSGKTMAQVGINWCICKSSTIPIPRAKNIKQAQEHIGALGWRLSPAKVTEL